GAPEQLHVGGILRPAHLGLLVYGGHAVHKLFHGPQKRIQEGLLTVASARHEDAQRLGDQENHKKKKENLTPPISGHALEVLGFEKRIKQVRQQQAANSQEAGIC